MILSFYLTKRYVTGDKWNWMQLKCIQTLKKVKRMSKYTQIIMCQWKNLIVVAKAEIVYRVFRKTFCIELAFSKCFGCIMQEKATAFKKFYINS